MTDGLKTADAAHRGTDPRIKSAGDRTDNGSTDVAPIGEIIDISVDEVSKVKPHCSEEVKSKVDQAFKGVDRSKYGRTTQQPPKAGTDGHRSLSRGDSHGRTPRKGRR